MTLRELKAIEAPALALLGSRFLLFEEFLFDVLVDSDQPLLGTLSALLGALGPVLVVAHIRFELADPLLGNAQLHGELVRQIHGAVAIAARRLGRLLQQRDDRLPGTIDRIVVARVTLDV